MTTTQAADVSWVLGSAFRIMMMQGGFALLEAGSVRAANTVNIMMKNMVDMGLGGLIFFVLGYGLYAGEGIPFIGGEYFFCVGIKDFTPWIFNLSFAATAATIDSGAIAERMSFMAYICLSLFTTGVVYPICARAFWYEQGIFANFGIGVHDFAGSGAVHLLGATSALVAATMIGPRRLVLLRKIQHAKALFVADQFEVHQLYGTFILGISWLSFNCGSVGVLTEGNNADKVSLVACNTIVGKFQLFVKFQCLSLHFLTVFCTIGGGAGMLSGMLYSYKKFGKIVVPLTMNPFLGGLVSITANCDVIEPYDALIIGFTSFLAYGAGEKFLEYVGVDDPLSAVPVHGFCGIYAMITTAFFSHETGIFYTGKFEALGVQLVATLFIIGFTASLTYLCLLIVSTFEPLRVKAYQEDVGLDFSEHGCSAIEVARTKLTQSLIYHCDTLDHKDVRNPFRNLLNVIDIDTEKFSDNWHVFKSMFAQQSETERQHAEIKMAALLDFRDEQQKEVYIQKQTEKLKHEANDDEEFGQSQRILVRAMETDTDTGDEETLRKSIQLTQTIISEQNDDQFSDLDSQV